MHSNSYFIALNMNMSLYGVRPVIQTLCRLSFEGIHDKSMPYFKRQYSNVSNDVEHFCDCGTSSLVCLNEMVAGFWTPLNIIGLNWFEFSRKLHKFDLVSISLTTLDIKLNWRPLYRKNVHWICVIWLCSQDVFVFCSNEQMLYKLQR